MSAFDWEAWRTFYVRLQALHGPKVWREAVFRAALGMASQAAWLRDAPADPPDRPTVLVIGHQRSGTTWLHRMLARHPAATAMPLHTLLLPADGWQRRFDRPRPRWLDQLQDRLLGPLDDLHRIRLHEPEEDEFLLWALFRSPMCTLDRPWPPSGPPPNDGDEIALAFYAQAVARHARRTERRYVGKNPHFTWRSDAVRRALPGVKLVQLWRWPEQAIASRLSLVRAIWRRRGLATELRPHDVEHIYRSSVRTYLGGLGAADLDVPYAELVADPLGVVERIHETLGLEPWTDLQALGPHLRSNTRPHRYSLAEFGLDPARLERDLEPVYGAIDFG